MADESTPTVTEDILQAAQLRGLTLRRMTLSKSTIFELEIHGKPFATIFAFHEEAHAWACAQFAGAEKSAREKHK